MLSLALVLCCLMVSAAVTYAQEKDIVDTAVGQALQHPGRRR